MGPLGKGDFDLAKQEHCQDIVKSSYMPQTVTCKVTSRVLCSFMAFPVKTSTSWSSPVKDHKCA